MPRILALWLPNWPVQRLLHSLPHGSQSSQQAIVLYEQDHRGQRVKACSAVAWQQGVRPGMPLAEAQASIQLGGGEGTVESAARLKPAAQQNSSAPPFFARHDPQADRRQLEQLAAACEAFSPLVGLESVEEPDGLLLDIRGIARLFGGEEALARQAIGVFAQRGWTVHAAVADTPRAAGAVARFALPTSNCRIVPPGDQTIIAGLPIESLQLTDRSNEPLQRLGLCRIGQLQRLPRRSLATRFDTELLRRLDQLVGAVADVIVSYRPQIDLAVRRVLEQALSHPAAIEQVLEESLAELVNGLIARKQGVLQLECRLVCQNRQPLLIHVGLFQPTARADHLLALVKMQLERRTLSDAVEEIHLSAVATTTRQPRQNDLFSNLSREQPAHVAMLIERLSNRLGCENVVRARLQSESQAELAYVCTPLTGQPAEATDMEAVDPPPGPLLRPLRLIDPPQPIEVVGIVGDGPPAMFHHRRQPHRVARSFGPERIETGWWRGPSSRRDYYRVETETGHRWWLFRRLQDHHWFLQGEFA